MSKKPFIPIFYNESKRLMDDVTSMREDLRIQQINRALRSRKSDLVDTETGRYEEFARLIRDGVADEVRNVVLEIRREMEQHRKLGRLTKISNDLVDELDNFFDVFLKKKELLQKLENALSSIRDNLRKEPDNRNLQHKCNTALENARKVREDVIAAADKVLSYRERIDNQIKKDRDLENDLEDTLERCLKHVSTNERRRIEGYVRRHSEKATIDQRIKLLSKLVEQLAQSVPAIRQEEIQHLYYLARSEFQKKNFNESLNVLNKLFKFDRKHLFSHRLRARIFQLLGNKVAWLCELRMITELDSAEAMDFHALGEALVLEGNHDDAYQQFERAAQKSPEKIYMERFADMACTFRHWYRAVEVYRKILKKHPYDVSIQHKLGRSLFEDNREEEAFGILRHVIQMDDSNSQSRVSLGEMFRRRGLATAAVESFARAIELDPRNVDAFYWWGMQLYDRGDFSVALEKALEAYGLEPDRIRNRILLARCYEAVGHLKDAVEILEPIVNQESPSIDSVLTFSEICRHGNGLELAKETVERILQRYSRLPMLRTEYGFILLQQGHFKQAASYLDPLGGFKASVS